MDIMALNRLICSYIMNISYLIRLYKLNHLKDLPLREEEKRKQILLRKKISLNIGCEVGKQAFRGSRKYKQTS